MKDLAAILRVQELLEFNAAGSGSTLEGAFGREYSLALAHLLRRVRTSRQSDGSIRLRWHGSRCASDPIVSCPLCGNRGRLMEKFSLLQQGFNGIKAGSPDDLDAQECGKCGAVLEWREILVLNLD